MNKADQFIKEHTNQCSNVVTAGEGKSTLYEYHEWLTPEQALRAIEIEREELLDKASKFIRIPNIYVVDFNKNGGATINYEATVEKFKKYMEE